jgi:short-subunit dehydrogenase
MAGFAGFPFQTLYCATKYAVRGLSEALRAELAGTGVRVTCVMPGTTATGIISSAASRDAALTSKMGGLLQRFGGSPDKLARRIVRGVRWNRFAVHGQLDSVLLDLAARTAPWLVRAMMAMMVRAARRRGWVGA